jgi:L-fucono-1,5-lactonase
VSATRSAAGPRRIDAHQHFWRYEAADYGWIDEPMAALRRDFLPADLEPLLASAGFDATIAVQTCHTLDETAWLLDLADRHPFIAGVVGWVDLQSPEVRSQLDRFAGRRKLRGVRHVVQAEPDPRFLMRPDFERGIAMLQELGLSYDILVYPRHLVVAAEFARVFAGHPLVLDHLGKPDIRSGGIRPWARDLRRLAECSNVSAKLSGLVTEADWKAWTPAQIEQCLDVAFDCFGPERLMIGSDWPVCTVAGDYGRVMRVVTGYLDRRPQAERDAVLGGNAARFYRIDPVEAR